MSVPYHNIVQFAEDVMSSLVGVQASAIGHEAHQDRKDFVSGTVEIHGAWSGTVQLVCTPAMARKIASAMFEVDPEQATPEEIKDVLGELANIFAGNVKPLLPGPSNLCLPSADVTARRVELHPGEEAWLECFGEPFVVKVLNEDGRPGVASVR